MFSIDQNGNVIGSLSEAWTKLPVNLKFINSESAKKISTKPGVYAWYLPYRLKQDDESPYSVLERLIPYINYFGKDKKIQNYKFGWENFELSIDKKSAYSGKPNFLKLEAWQRIKKNQSSYDLFRKIMLGSTVFSSPIYVGLAGNLAVRYNQHVNGIGRRNTFNKRFNEFSSTLDKHLALNFKDLYFSYIEIDISDSQDQIIKMFDDSDESDELEGDMITVLEDVLKFAIKPCFGER